MPDYIRSRFGNTYFFTVVTYQRRPLFSIEQCRVLLRDILKEVQALHPFNIEALVLLPDHLHCIWKLPDSDVDYSMRWGLIKKEFTKQIKNLFAGRAALAKEAKCAPPAIVTRSRERHREGTIWQRRFWEHQIRDESDFRAHCDYIHYNPVKHGLVNAPRDWAYSTFNRYVRDGLYEPEWGAERELKFELVVGKE